jgi:adenine/guanine phosphoribosyltransferase-like PRPP-binding protein
MSSTAAATTASPLTEDEQRFVKELMPTCDFKGVKFKDISPLLFNPKAMKLVCDSIAAVYKSKNIQAVAGLEAR